MRKLYLDIDGVLLTKRNTRAADGAIELIEYALSNFDCYWLNTHCRTSDTKDVLRYLAEYFPNDVVDRLKEVKPAIWDTLKTEGIDFNSKFYWLDDCLFEAEKRALEYYQCIGSIIKVNLDYQDELKWVVQVLKDKEADYEHYLFLDLDGVLNTMDYSEKLIEDGHSDTDEDGAIFDPNTIEQLKVIVESTHPKIILSSTWRFKGEDWIKQLWHKRELPGEIYGLTPALENVCFKNLEGGQNSFSVYPYGTRGLEINEWLRKNVMGKYQSYSYAIIDDEDDFLSIQSEHLVLTDPRKGITEEIANKAIRILK